MKQLQIISFIAALWCLPFLNFAQMNYPKEKIVIEIWSDVVCPFCYVGKRRLEQAIEKSSLNKTIEIHWRSYQLDPNIVTDPSKNPTQSLAEKKGWSIEQTEQITAQVTNMAAEVGLEYHLNKSVVANTLNAHKLIHFAQENGKGSEVKEALLKSYFTDAKNIDNVEVLLQIAKHNQLDTEKAAMAIKSEEYTDKVRQDIYAAQQVGVRGVPFFVFNNSFAVSGAQAEEIFLNALQQADKQ